MKSIKNLTAIASVLFSLHAQAMVTSENAINETSQVNVKGQVMQVVKHQDISCLFISASKQDVNGDVIPMSHEKGGDVMACSAEPLDFKSLKHKYVAVSADYLTMNHDKNDRNLESYPVVKIKLLEKLAVQQPVYVANSLPAGYHDPGFYARTR